MNPYDFDVRLTPEAQRMLRPGEALTSDFAHLYGHFPSSTI
jgi:hypothetical protein